MISFLKELWSALTEGWDEREIQYIPAPVSPPVPPSAPLPPKPITMPTIGVTDLYDDWSKPKNAYHNVRVLCDRANLSLDEKNLICACVYQESTFLNSAINRNKDKAGNVTSTDWGIAQVNDYFHIGKGKDFPIVEYVVNNPQHVIEWMIGMYKQGQLYQWSSYRYGAYKQWLKPTSPMWSLGKTS